MKANRKLSEYLVAPPRPTLAEVDQRFGKVQQRIRTRRTVRRSAIAAGVMMAVVAVGLGLRSQGGIEVREGSEIDNSDTSVTLSLREGTEVDVAPHSRLKVDHEAADEVVLLLETGVVRLDVARKPERKFIVRAGDVEVRVVGTRFEVRHTGDEVAVSVSRGIVEVRMGDEVRRLTAGESWSRVAPVPDSVEEASSFDFPGLDLSEPVMRRLRQLRAPTRTKRVHKHTQKVSSSKLVAPAPAAPAAEPEPLEAEPAETPRSVFNAAAHLRREGQLAEAAQQFEHLLQKWPSDAFAPLGAFELGRLKMDDLKDPRGAARAFAQVVALQSDPGLTEDALARMVELYDRFDAARCKQTRSRYLSEFPTGIHVQAVSSHCPTP
jgi:hypothetical protein